MLLVGWQKAGLVKTLAASIGRTRSGIHKPCPVPPALSVRHPGTKTLCVFTASLQLFPVCVLTSQSWYPCPCDTFCRLLIHGFLLYFPHHSAAYSKPWNAGLCQVRDNSPLLASQVLSGCVSVSELIPSQLDSQCNRFLCDAVSSNTFSPSLCFLKPQLISLLLCEVLCQNFLHTALETHLLFLTGTFL